MLTEFKIVYDKEWEEWIVQYIEDGVVNEAKSYHTEDGADAISTAAAMLRELKKQHPERVPPKKPLTTGQGDRLEIPI